MFETVIYSSIEKEAVHSTASFVVYTGRIEERCGIGIAKQFPMRRKTPGADARGSISELF